MEPFSVRSKICGVLNTVAPLHLPIKGVAFFLHSKIGESQVCCMKSGVFKKTGTRSFSDSQNQQSGLLF